MTSAIFLLTVIAAFTAAATAALIVILRPLLLRYALARPNSRSSHLEPTPQGGGIAIVIVVVAVVATATFALQTPPADARWFFLLFGAMILIAVVGAIDDIKALTVAPRLVLQAIAVALMLTALPAELRVVPTLPWWIERALMLVAGLWFVNLTNFMDGIDWMTVAEIVPITAMLVVMGYADALPTHGLVVALVLGSTILGFAPFNKPVARLFLGDVGSLPIGLLLAWLLVLLAGEGHIAAALLLPFYYGADTTLTLIRRMLKRERVWDAHRSHFYQRATTGGFTVIEVIARVFAPNVVLALMAFATVRFNAVLADALALAAATALVGWLLWSFAKGKPR